MAADCAVRMRDITKRFRTPAGGTYTAVKGISFDVRAGSFVAVVGPSGCGKSTVLNMAAGLMSPSEGTIEIGGEPLTGINRQATYMFQQDALLPWKTVLDNTVIGLALRGIPRDQREVTGREWLERVGLAQFADHFPHQLSGGMKKRVAIAQNWIVNPDILLMDEPFGALDSQTRQRMEEELLAIWAESRKTVIFVTHDLDEAIALSDEVIVLSMGPESRVVGRFPIDLPRPRALLDLRTDKRFAELYELIWSSLKGEVLRSYEQAH